MQITPVGHHVPPARMAGIKMSDSNKCCEDVERWAVPHGWRGCDAGPPLWVTPGLTVRWLLTRLNREGLSGWQVPSRLPHKACVFTGLSPGVHQQMDKKKMWSVHPLECYPAMKRNHVLTMTQHGEALEILRSVEEARRPRPHVP